MKLIDKVLRSEDQVKKGKVIKADTSMKDEEIDDLQVDVTIPSLGVKFVSSGITVDESSSSGAAVALSVPREADPGFYLVRVVISSDDVQKVLHREIRVV